MPVFELNVTSVWWPRAAIVKKKTTKKQTEFIKVIKKIF